MMVYEVRTDWYRNVTVLQTIIIGDAMLIE